MSKEKIKTPVLDHFTVKISDLVKQDKWEGREYFYRRKEVDNLVKAMLKNTARNIAIIGPKGCGRETLLKIFQNNIDRGIFPKKIAYTEIFKLDWEDLAAGTQYRGQYEERIKAVHDELAKLIQPILYLPQGFSLFHDSSNLSTMILNKARFITTLTLEEASEFFKLPGNRLYNYEIVNVRPPRKDDIIEIININCTYFEKTYSLEIPSKIPSQIVELTEGYATEISNPLKSIQLIEEIGAIADLNRINSPAPQLQKIRKKYEELHKQINDLSSKKIEVVRKQKYEEAGKLRDLQKELEVELSELKKELIHKIGQTPHKVTENDVFEGVAQLTGLSVEDVKSGKFLNKRTPYEEGRRTDRIPKYEVLQAQSILHGDEISIIPGVAFVLIPHTDEYDELFISIIKPALESHELKVLKASDIFKPGNILSQVWAQIRSAEVVIADVSGQNANVIFELGLCYGIHRCPILLTRNPDELPFNIRNLRYIEYEDSMKGAEKLKKDLSRAVAEFLSAVRYAE